MTVRCLFLSRRCQSKRYHRHKGFRSRRASKYSACRSIKSINSLYAFVAAFLSVNGYRIRTNSRDEKSIRFRDIRVSRQLHGSIGSFSIARQSEIFRLRLISCFSESASPGIGSRTTRNRSTLETPWIKFGKGWSNGPTPIRMDRYELLPVSWAIEL